MSGCAVLGCPKTQKKSKGVTFHQFPLKNEDLCQDWDEKCGNVSSEKTWAKKKICGDHFLPEDFTKEGSNKRLKENVVPTVGVYPSKINCVL